MALGLLRAFRESENFVPEDIGLVGFDDVLEASSYAPPLSSIHQKLCGRWQPMPRQRP